MKNFFCDRHLASNPYLNFFEAFAWLFVLWIVMSGIFTLKFLLFGLVSSFFISCCVISHMCLNGIKSEKKYFILHVNYYRLLLYFFWLVNEIIKSALAVAKIIITGNKKIDPYVIWFKADYDNPVARAILANSITLTPGTVSIDIFDDGIYSVHALNKEFADGLLSGDMQRKIAMLYGEDIDYRVFDVITDSDYNPAEFVGLRHKKFKRVKKNYD